MLFRRWRRVSSLSRTKGSTAGENNMFPSYSPTCVRLFVWFLIYDCPSQSLLPANSSPRPGARLSDWLLSAPKSSSNEKNLCQTGSNLPRREWILLVGFQYSYYMKCGVLILMFISAIFPNWKKIFTLVYKSILCYAIIYINNIQKQCLLSGLSVSAIQRWQRKLG